MAAAVLLGLALTAVVVVVWVAGDSGKDAAERGDGRALLDGPSRSSGAPAGKSTAPKRATAPKAPARRNPARATLASRRFAWAPRPGASGYHVELFKGQALVFRATTSKPQIVIPRRWRLNGRTHTLEPGSYRWYVWARVGGRREAKATVQAKLVLSTR